LLHRILFGVFAPISAELRRVRHDSDLAVLHWNRPIPYAPFAANPPEGRGRVAFYDERLAPVPESSSRRTFNCLEEWRVCLKTTRRRRSSTELSDCSGLDIGEKVMHNPYPDASREGRCQSDSLYDSVPTTTARKTLSLSHGRGHVQKRRWEAPVGFLASSVLSTSGAVREQSRKSWRWGQIRSER